MTTDWDRTETETPGTVESYGRRFRTYFGGAMKALDPTMIDLLIPLFKMPGVMGSKADQDADMEPTG